MPHKYYLDLDLKLEVEYIFPFYDADDIEITNIWLYGDWKDVNHETLELEYARIDILPYLNEAFVDEIYKDICESL